MVGCVNTLFITFIMGRVRSLQFLYKGLSIETTMSTMTNNNNSSPKNDRPSIALDVYAALCHAEGKGEANVALTGIRMIGCSPLRTGTQDVFTYAIADILESIRAANGYTQDVQGFISSVEMFHTNRNTGVQELVIPKRMHTSVNSLYRSKQYGGKKYLNSVCRDMFGADWWKTDKAVRQETVLLRAIEGTLPVKELKAPDPAPANDHFHNSLFAEQFAQYTNKTVAPTPAPAPAPAPMPQTVEEMLEQLRANGSTTIPTSPDPEVLVPKTLSIESTKAELAAVVSKNLGIDMKQAMLMNKETLVSLL